MSVVWSGRHGTQQVPVAVKVLTAQRARNQAHLAAFRREARALARLHHPHIVRIFDFGHVDTAAARLSDGRLAQGCPYMVMELAEMGPLSPLLGAHDPLAWPEIKQIIMETLDALAHAHTRGVIHRDLKPGNVLLSRSPEGRPVVSLTDFGIAHALDLGLRWSSDAVEPNASSPPADAATSHALDPDGTIYGTPAYMAPEQFSDDVRKVGPWTDLYALGCMVFEMVCGSRPFVARDLLGLVKAHMHTAPPPLCPQVDVPDGLDAWVGRLMAKAAKERYRTAADAAWALTLLSPTANFASPWSAARVHARDLPSTASDASAGDPTPHRPHDGERPQASDTPTTRADPPQWSPSTVLSTLAALEEQANQGRREADHAATTRWQHLPPLPASWQRPHPAAPSPRLEGTGIALFGLRTPALVGRHDEREHIWRAVQEMRATCSPRAVIVRGAAGIGKSRLAEWVCERLDELGVATRLDARHEPTPAPRSGVVGMLARHLRCFGLEKDELIEHLAAWIQGSPMPDDCSHEAHKLAALVDPEAFVVHAEQSALNAVSHLDEAASRAVARRTLARIAHERPLAVWLDDVQWGAEALAVVEDILRGDPDLPVLFLLTLHEGALAEGQRAADTLARITALPACSSLTLRPLDPGEQHQLVASLLPLDEALEAQVVARSAGSPLFALQLIGDWVARDILTLGPHGFGLKPGVEPYLPDDIYDLWHAGLERLALSMRMPLAQIHLALELAATLGGHIDDREWKQLCVRAQIPRATDLIPAMVKAGLVESDDTGWAFAHRMLHEALLRSATQSERLASHHAICAQVLAGLYRPGADGVAERIGVHWLAAGEPEFALVPLLHAAESRRRAAALPEAMQLLDLRDEALAELGLSQGPHNAAGLAVRARIFALQSRLHEAQAAIEKASVSSEFLDPWWQGYVAFVLANVQRKRGHHHQALSSYQQAILAFRSANAPGQEASALLGVGKTLRFEGRNQEAWAYYDRARELARYAGDALAFADATMSMGEIAVRRERFDEGERLLRRALELFEELGNWERIGAVCNDLGEAARLREHFDDAEPFYKRAVDALTFVRSRDVTFPLLNLALVQRTLGRLEMARDGLMRVADIFEEQGRKALAAIVHVNLAECVATMGDWAQAESFLRAACTTFEHVQAYDRDVAIPAEKLGDRGVAQRRPAIAERAYALAYEQWLALERTEDAERVARSRALLPEDWC